MDGNVRDNGLQRVELVRLVPLYTNPEIIWRERAGHKRYVDAIRHSLEVVTDGRM